MSTKNQKQAASETIVKPIPNTPVVPDELQELYMEANRLSLLRDILSLKLEIKELEKLVNGDTYSEEADS